MNREHRDHNSLHPHVLLALLLLAATTAMSRPLPLGATAPETSPWGAVSTVISGWPHAAHPTLAYTPQGTAYAIWESNSILYYAVRPPGKPWGQASSIASGMSPEMIIDPAGNLHVVFTNRFMGNYEIYYVTHGPSGWSFPVNISHTSGASSEPTLARTSDGVLHAAWTDQTSGYETIYYARYDGYWTSEPVSNARGKAPSLAVAADGTLYLAWQDHFPSSNDPSDAFDILLSHRENGQWSLPMNLSDRQGIKSLGADLTATTDGLVHATWIDQGREIRYSYGLGFAWSEPESVALAASGARGSQIIADQFNQLHIAWDEGNMVWEASATPGPYLWPDGNLVTPSGGNIQDIALTTIPKQGLGMAWVENLGPGNATIHESQHMIRLEPRSWLPILVTP